MATRAHIIIANLEAALEAITPDEQSGARDTFRSMPGLDTTESPISRDRSFILAPGSTALRDNRFIGATTPAVCVIELGLGVAYQNTKNVLSRLLKDSERILDALEGFQSTYCADILELDISSGTIEALDRTVIAEYVISISYSLDLSEG